MINMRSELINQLQLDNDYFIYLRENPIWFKVLSIYPERFKEFLNEYKVIRKKRAIDKIDDINAMINLAETFLRK